MSKNPLVIWADDGNDAAVAARVSDALTAGAARLAVPGGRTPQSIFGRLVARVADWSGITVMLTDDRITPPAHPAGNQAMLDATLGATGANIARLAEGARVVPCDLIWLGMGEDGHIASLFPSMVAQDLAGPRVIKSLPAPLPPEAPFARLSLNWEALSDARETLVVVRGATKKPVLKQVLAGRSDLPGARLIRQTRSPVTVYWSEA